MTPQAGDSVLSENRLVALMVAIGRIEETQKTIITGQDKLENRVMTENEKLEARIAALETHNRALEKLVERLDATKPEKTKLVTILTGVAATVAILLGFANLQVIQQNRTQQSIQLELLQKNQDELIKKTTPTVTTTPTK